MLSLSWVNQLNKIKEIPHTREVGFLLLV
uniref:Uncharacterized protein n=1 Tax=Anguilla anguilla TaxID=7936 RepID=A0A0E9U9K8_ANGAN